ncbi:MAG TPA: D-TA family PLP-dependent enzyme [Clostridia bacterium]|nr:D-TA family PLP-dependent enzyme [Clostridia bacterium]
MLDPALYAVENLEAIASPSLLYFKDIIAENTRKAVDMAGGPDRLWPHVKTHKMREMIQMQLAAGIRRFKCATLEELQMTASCGAGQILLAYPLLGPNVSTFLALVRAYPKTCLYALEDEAQGLRALSEAAVQAGLTVKVMLDINLGMNRTGVVPALARSLYELGASLPGLEMAGLHGYDGHRTEPAFSERKALASSALDPVRELRRQLEAEGLSCPNVILGGTPTFPVHAAEENVYLSPGTVFVSHWPYLVRYPELPFVPGAAVLGRAISRPAKGLFTLDVGTKALASEMQEPRGVILGWEDAVEVGQSEEHRVFRVPEGRPVPALGQPLLVFPSHICPTTALHEHALVVQGGRVTGRWTVAARNRTVALPAEGKEAR